ncbi:bifunctional 3-(3-hydroxy-phenyl)propionate/3-hydroxycinnamic acid hydroxylase [Actinomycetes bacterium KLBMP 9797]
MTRHVPVVIIGAGPTGTTAAIMLAQRGIECLVLDRWPEVYPLPRAVHFDDEVFRVFADLGIAEQVRAISRPALGMQLVDTQLRVLAEFTRDPSGRIHGYPQANMFDQPDLERVLRDRLAELPRAELRGDVEVFAIDQVPGGPAPVRVRYRDLTTGTERAVWADAVLGCDGANSVTRARIGAETEDLGFSQQWLVVDAHSPQPLPGYDGVQQVCDPDRAATFMMVTPGRYRWEFRLRPDEQPDELTEAQIIGLIRPWLGTVDPDKLTLLRRTWYTFRGAIADRWRAGRVFLLGDAAHLTPPFIGQGMCAGIRDAANLTWKLALVLTGRADDRLLSTYEAERRPYARRVVRMAILVGWLMTGGTARTARVRRAVLRTATRLPGVERRALDVAWPAFAAGPLTARRDRAAGRLCPQPRVRVDSGDLPLDQVLGSGFAIVSRRDDVAAFDPATRAYFDALDTRVVPCDDRDGTLTALLDRAGADALLVRPDRVIAASADRPDLRGWRRLLEAAGISGPTSPRATTGTRSIYPT